MALYQAPFNGGGSGSADTTFIYCRPDTTGKVTEQTVQHNADNKFYIILSLYNGANGNYLDNVHIYTKTAGGSYVEQTAWKGVTALAVGKSSTGNYTGGYSAFILEINAGETGFFDIKQGMTIKLALTGNLSIGVGMIF